MDLPRCRFWWQGLQARHHQLQLRSPNQPAEATQAAATRSQAITGRRSRGRRQVRGRRDLHSAIPSGTPLPPAALRQLSDRSEVSAPGKNGMAHNGNCRRARIGGPVVAHPGIWVWPFPRLLIEVPPTAACRSFCQNPCMRCSLGIAAIISASGFNR